MVEAASPSPTTTRGSPIKTHGTNGTEDECTIHQIDSNEGTCIVFDSQIKAPSPTSRKRLSFERDRLENENRVMKRDLEILTEKYETLKREMVEERREIEEKKSRKTSLLSSSSQQRTQKSDKNPSRRLRFGNSAPPQASMITVALHSTLPSQTALGHGGGSLLVQTDDEILLQRLEESEKAREASEKAREASEKAREASAIEAEVEQEMLRISAATIVQLREELEEARASRP